MDALRNGCSIVVDVNGVIGGFNKQNPKDFKNDIVCNISSPDIMKQAKKEGKTDLRWQCVQPLQISREGL